MASDDRGEEEAVIDPQSGAIIERDQSIGFFELPVREDGAMLTVDMEADPDEVFVRHADGRMEPILALDGGSDYGYRFPIWAPDGEWVAVVDSSGRLLISGLDEEGARVLADDVNEMAWTTSAGFGSQAGR
jgi:hypothetical protein